VTDGAVDLVLRLAEREDVSIDRVGLGLALRELERLLWEAGEEGGLGILTRDKGRIEGFSAAEAFRENLGRLEAGTTGDGADDGRAGVTTIGEESVLSLGLVLVLVVMSSKT
jgi:hypothetical protein